MARKRSKIEETKADMTPMIDVTFQLLIFFLVTFKFKTLEGRLDAALPKDRGTQSQQTEEIEKVDIIISVANEGQLVPDPAAKGRLKHYVNRTLRYEVGTQTFTSIEDLDKFLDKFALTEKQREETPVSLDSRKGTIYADVVPVLDVVIEKQFKKIAFAGSFEEE